MTSCVAVLGAHDTQGPRVAPQPHGLQTSDPDPAGRQPAPLRPGRDGARRRPLGGPCPLEWPGGGAGRRGRVESRVAWASRSPPRAQGSSLLQPPRTPGRHRGRVQAPRAGRRPQASLRARAAPAPGSWRCPTPTSAVPTAPVPASPRPTGSGRQRTPTRRTRRLPAGCWAFLRDRPRATVSDSCGRGRAGGASWRGLERRPGGAKRDPRRDCRWPAHDLVPRPSKAVPQRCRGESNDQDTVCRKEPTVQVTCMRVAGGRPGSGTQGQRRCAGPLEGAVPRRGTRGTSWRAAVRRRAGLGCHRAQALSLFLSPLSDDPVGELQLEMGDTKPHPSVQCSPAPGEVVSGGGQDFGPVAGPFVACRLQDAPPREMAREPFHGAWGRGSRGGRGGAPSRRPSQPTGRCTSGGSVSG